MSSDEESVEPLLDYLKATRGFDFTAYKRSSLLRRVQKRLQAVNIGSYEQYQTYLKAHPEEVTLQDGAEPFDVRVREVSGEERAQWWERAVAAYPPYAQYQQRTERQIPVFVATSVE